MRKTLLSPAILATFALAAAARTADARDITIASKDIGAD